MGLGVLERFTQVQQESENAAMIYDGSTSRELDCHIFLLHESH